MVQNGEINRILPVDSIWSGSSISTEQVNHIVETSGSFKESLAGVFILVLLLFFLLFGKTIIASFSNVFKFVFVSSENKNGNGSSVFGSLLVVMSFICPTAAALAFRYRFFTPDSFSDFSPVMNYVLVLSMLVGFFIVRKIVISAIGAVSGMRSLFSSSEKVLPVFFIFFVLLSVLPLPFTFLLNNPDYHTIRIILYCMLSVLFFIYLVYVGKIIISSGVSHFFCFLYLCTLEILPVFLILTTMSNLSKI